jgi:cell wall-associated NlpC family hydrolase
VFYPRMLGVLVMVGVLGALVVGVPVMADTNLPIGGQGQVVNTDGEGVRVLEEGWRVTVLAGPVAGATGGDWYKITHTDVTGFVLSDFLTTATGATGGLLIGERARVATDDGASLRLRDAPGGAVLTTMPNGARVTVTAGPTTDTGAQRWFQVNYQDQQGWALGAYLQPIPEAASSRETTSRAGTRPETTPDEPRRANGGGAAIASVVRKYVGSRYVWGGTGPAGFDCSGLVRYVVAEAVGIQLGRDVFAQATAGEPIAPGDLQPGDLVFHQNTYRWGLSHVGIYIGNGQMVSAQSESTGVRVVNIWDGYWGPRFHSARRLVK